MRTSVNRALTCAVCGNSNLILLPDGYNGHMRWFDATPVECDGHLVKLRCAEQGKEYMFRWARRSDLGTSDKPAHLGTVTILREQHVARLAAFEAREAEYDARNERAREEWIDKFRGMAEFEQFVRDLE